MTGARCSGTAFLYSGRPDPQWPIAAKQLQRLTLLWKQLPTHQTPPPAAPALGYRGCAVRSATGERWFAYGGVVSLTGGTHRPEYRLDAKRQFEGYVLATAPPGEIPDAAVSIQE